MATNTFVKLKDENIKGAINNTGYSISSE